MNATEIETQITALTVMLLSRYPDGLARLTHVLESCIEVGEEMGARALAKQGLRLISNYPDPRPAEQLPTE